MCFFDTVFGLCPSVGGSADRLVLSPVRMLLGGKRGDGWRPDVGLCIPAAFVLRNKRADNDVNFGMK